MFKVPERCMDNIFFSGDKKGEFEIQLEIKTHFRNSLMACHVNQNKEFTVCAAFNLISRLAEGS